MQRITEARYRASGVSTEGEESKVSSSKFRVFQELGFLSVRTATDSDD